MKTLVMKPAYRRALGEAACMLNGNADGLRAAYFNAKTGKWSPGFAKRDHDEYIRVANLLVAMAKEADGDDAIPRLSGQRTQ